MFGSKHCILAAILYMATICAASGQSLPKIQPELARELFTTYASCRAYWELMTQCLPSGLEPQEDAQLRQSFNQLQIVGDAHMKWLAAKAQISPAIQQRIADKATSRVSSAAGSGCDNAPSLVQEYRDKCAALFRNVGAAQKEASSINQPTEAETAVSAAKFIISTCYEAIDDISRVTSYARVMKWKALSPDHKNIMKPVDSTFHEAWEVDRDGITYIVSVNRGRFNQGRFKGRPTEVCQVAVPYHSAPIISRIKQTISTRSIGTTNTGVQITDMYELGSHPSITPAAMIVARDPGVSEFFTVAFVGVK